MATYNSVADVMVRIRRLPEAVAERAVEIMKEEVPVGEGYKGHLRDTIKAEKMADGTYTVSTNKFVGGGQYGIREVGAIIRAGRRGMSARYEDLLKWHDEDGWHSAVSVGPARPNDFVKNTMKRLNDEVSAKGLGMAD